MKKLLTVLMAFCISNSLWADFHIEPYLGYQTGSGKYSDYGITLAGGELYGARLNYNLFGGIIGIDYNRGSFDFEFDPPFKVSDPVDSSEFAIVAGYTFSSIYFKIFLKYIIQAKFKYEDGSYQKGDGVGIGIGTTVLPIVDINLEYKFNSYYEDEIGSLPTSIDASIIALTISVPINLSTMSLSKK